MANQTRSEKFWSRVAKAAPDECWEWTGALDRYGYGDFRVRPEGHIIAHRFAYEDRVGAIPAGLVIDHLCRNRACCNPRHMEPVTNAENLRRGKGATGPPKRSHCRRGHALTEDNLYRSGRNRACRRCVLDRMKRNYQPA